MRLLAIISILLLSSCTMRYSMNGGSVPAEAKTFSVEYFTVRAPRADANYGQQTTEALKDLLLGQTRLSLANGQGDIAFEGEITGYDINPVAVSGDELAALSRLTVKMKIRYFNAIEPEKDKEFTVTQFEDFDASVDFLSVEANLLEAINEKILQDIYDKSLGDW